VSLGRRRHVGGLRSEAKAHTALFGPLSQRHPRAPWDSRAGHEATSTRRPRYRAFRWWKAAGALPCRPAVPTALPTQLACLRRARRVCSASRFAEHLTPAPGVAASAWTFLLHAHASLGELPSEAKLSRVLTPYVTSGAQPCGIFAAQAVFRQLSLARASGGKLIGSLTARLPSPSGLSTST
jgi:hypothetical protein